MIDRLKDKLDKLRTEGKDLELNRDDIIAIHDIIEKEYNLKYKGMKRSKYRLRQIVDEAKEFSDDKHKQLAKLVHTLKRTETFEDANKRTLYIYMLYFLEENGLDYNIHSATVEPYKVITHIGMYDVEQLEKWIKEGEIDGSKLP